MKTVLNMLREKLNTLGYNDSIINSVVAKLDLEPFEKYYSENEIPSDMILVEEFDEPNVEIIQLLLTITLKITQAEILEGDISISSTDTAVGTRVAIADYSLDKRSAVIGISSDYKIKIIQYKPNPKVQNLYRNTTYEQYYREDRDDITKDYYEAFVQNGRVPERKVREILTVLVADFVIDEMAVYDANPKIKLYDNEQTYAENLYSYSLRYINGRTNRIEILNKTARIKMASKSVQPGLITNDPYIKIDKLPPQTDFPLNTISYYWWYGSRGNQEELAVFVPPRIYPQAMFSELKQEDPRINEVTMDLVRRFRSDVGFSLDPEEIKNILSKLNVELMSPSLNIIRANLTNRADTVEPIRYRYKVITDPAEFEEKLYITIEDNVSRRYKYMLVENILDDLTTIGNKLEYTDERGHLVRKQSVADFNVNAPAAIVRRETFTDITKIPELLGYIYEDMTYYGTDSLPVPSIEIDFYVPKGAINRSNVVMYNGTQAENSGSRQNLFNTDSQISSNYVIGSGNVLPGSTSVTVRCVNSKGEILKENKIGNVFPKTSYMPDVIPVINDKEGKEWIVENASVMPFTLTSNPDENIVQIRYIEKYARVDVSFINREGKRIAPDKQEIVQVGATYDATSKSICKDENGDDWKLLFSKPTKLVVKEQQDSNKIILVYDIERADVIIRYLTIEGKIIADEKVVQSAVDKVYSAERIPFITDFEGLGWDYVESSNPTVMVTNQGENIIKLLYQEAKRKVITRVESSESVVLRDDIIEFMQIGKRVHVDFDSDIYDFEAKEWYLSNPLRNEIIVNDDESLNVLEGIYSPKLAKVAVKFLSMDGRPIRESEIVDAQIGSRFNAEDKMEVMDNFGKLWTWKEKSDGILVTDSEMGNSVTLKYEPLMVKVTIKYLDAEMNELIPPKYETLQAGTSYKNTPMEKMTDASGKKWIIDRDKVPTIIVKKFEEENIVSIYYDKETAKVRLTFYDAYNNELREPQEIDSQIGALLETALYDRITDIHGNRWMMATSEPKNLTVRESGNQIKLIYDELKAKVLVKHINVNTQKPFVEDIVTTVKLGGIYVPNIRPIVLDKNKWQYKYIGEENISIVTKESEQDNIIVLTYDEDRSKVVLKYRNEKDEKIREDAIKEVQIGKEIKIDPILKFNDTNGLGWEYVSSDSNTKVVTPNENIIISHYKPLMAPIINKYLDEDEQDIVVPKEETMQVGKKYIPQIAERITDAQGALWKYQTISAEEVIVKDETNIITHGYAKFLSEVTVNLLDEDNQMIDEPMRQMIQIGTTFEAAYEKNYTDSEDKAWIFYSIDHTKITVAEEKEKNVINIHYKKEMAQVHLNYFNMNLGAIRGTLIVNAQIGSMYTPAPEKEIIDSESFGWALREDLLPTIKVNRNITENVLNLTYDKLLVDVTVNFKEDKNEDVISPNITKHQVGTTFMPDIEDYIEDEEGKEWIHALKLESKFFSTNKKVEPIKVVRDESKNVINLHYKPSLNKVVVRFVDPLGADIKPPDEVQAQIGSNYTPRIIEKIVGTGNKKWMYNPNSNSTIKISKEADKNVVNLAYEAEKAPVIYTYKTEEGVELKEPKKVLVQIGILHNTSPENVIEDEEGRVWEYKSKNLDEIKVEEDETKNIVDVVYAPMKVATIIRFVTLNGMQIIPDRTEKAQIGSIYKPLIDANISNEESKLFKFVKCEPESQKIQEVPLNAKMPLNVFTLTYEALFSKARIVFRDVDGNSLKDDEVQELQVGSVFAPAPVQYITDRQGIQWELINKDEKIEPLSVKEDERENVITMVYEVAKADVSVRFKDMDGNAIKETDIYHLKVGSEFVPEIENEIVDAEGKKWLYSYADPIKLTVGSINNIINVIYQEKKVMTIIKVQTTEGRGLKSDIRTKQQVGLRFSPAPESRVLYDSENMLWRYAYNNPPEITISENIEENVIIQYYTSDERKVTNNNGEFAYTAEMEKFVDKDIAAQVEKEEQEKREREEEERRRAAELASSEEIVNFTDPYLQQLERSIKLTNKEKGAINTLNDYNTRIVQLLHEAQEHEGDLDAFGLKDKLNNIMIKEKELVQTGLSDIIEEDRTGNKILKIFEAITSSEMNDKYFVLLQQKKSIIFADYFVNRNITDIEQANYIVEKGKTQSSLECINEKIAAAKSRDEELIKAKVILTYEDAMLDNYYRARSVVKDGYFNSEESKEKMPTEVRVIVANSLPNQAVKLFNKCMNLTVMQRNELDGIMRLLNSQQMTTVSNGIAKITDGKTRKNALKLYKEITGQK